MLPVCLFFASVPSLVRKPLGMLCRLFFFLREKNRMKGKKGQKYQRSLCRRNSSLCHWVFLRKQNFQNMTLYKQSNILTQSLYSFAKVIRDPLYPATNGMSMLRSGVELFFCRSEEGAVGFWHACGIPLKGQQQAGIVQSYLQTPLVLFFLWRCAVMLFLPSVTCTLGKATETAA